MKYFILSCIFLFSLNNAYSQSSFVASGGNSESLNTLNIDYSIGQIFYQNVTSNINYKEGVLQSFYVDGDVIEFDFISLKAYPNPTTNKIFISLGIDDIGALSYSVSSVAGAYIMEGDIDSNPFLLDVSTLANGVYFVHIFKQEKLNKTIKIIKY
tara:strand:- start:215 stop:679 length:465 start_codon:yes stop_codon:yes gene_type:complete